jgi:hypothetical protein
MSVLIDTLLMAGTELGKGSKDMGFELCTSMLMVDLPNDRLKIIVFGIVL